MGGREHRIERRDEHRRVSDAFAEQSHPMAFDVRRTISQPRKAANVAANARAGAGIASDGSRCPHAATSIPSATTDSATVMPRTTVRVGRRPPGDETPEVAVACSRIQSSLVETSIDASGCLRYSTRSR